MAKTYTERLLESVEKVEAADAALTYAEKNRNDTGRS